MNNQPSAVLNTQQVSGPSQSYVNPTTGRYEEAENWKPLPGFESRYQISDLGNVFDLRTRKSVAPQFQDGRLFLAIERGRGQRPYYCPIHRAVALAFVPNPDGLTWVVRRNGNRRDCRASNLLWAPAYGRILRSAPGGATPSVTDLSASALLSIPDDSMSPVLRPGSRVVIESLESAEYAGAIGLPVAVIVLANRFACYLGRLVSIDGDQVTVSRDNEQWPTRTESRAVIASVARIVSVLETPVC